MENSTNNTHSYITSGEYFKDARKWYKFKYISPFSHRSLLVLIYLITATIFLGIIYNIYNLYPVVKQVKYTIITKGSLHKTAQVRRANHVMNDPYLSVKDILLRNYIINRESYEYNNLKKQFTFLKNNASKEVFNKFYKEMDVVNPASPILKYQKNLNLKAEVINLKLGDNYEAQATVRIKTFNRNGAVTNQIEKNVSIKYEIDNINPALAEGSSFNFNITEYNSEIITKK